MKKIIAFVLCFIFIFSLTACNSGSNEAEDTPAPERETVQLSNPFQECQSLEEASELAGFEISVPDAVGEYSERIIRVISNEMIEVLYSKPESDSRIAIRKATGSKEISGDYNQYKVTNEAAVGELQVTMKGNDTNVSVAIWTNGNYSFSVSSTDSMDISTMEELISSIK